MCYMKKKLLVLLIAIIPTLMPNLASAIAIDLEEVRLRLQDEKPGSTVRYEKETTSTSDCFYSNIDAEFGICGGD